MGLSCPCPYIARARTRTNYAKGKQADWPNEEEKNWFFVGSVADVVVAAKEINKFVKCGKILGVYEAKI